METRTYYLKAASAAAELRREALGFSLEAHVALTDSGFRVTVSGEPNLIRRWEHSSHALKAA